MWSLKHRYMALVPFVVLIIPLLALGRWSPTSASPSHPQSTLPDGRRNPQSTLPDGRRNPTVFGSQILPNWAKQLITRAVEGNFSWLRYDGSRRHGLLWSNVEAEQGVRDWEQLSLFESEISLLSQNGITPIVVVRSTPDWAQKEPEHYCGPIREDALDDFADFMRELVERYSGPPYNVTYWEIWNEPDVDPALVPKDSRFGCWGDASDPYYGGGYYAEMLKQVYPAMKEANPNVQVMIGGLLLNCDPTHPPDGRDCKAANFLEGILQNGGGDYFDIVAYHGYAFWSPSGSGDWDLADVVWNHRGGLVVGKADFLREVLAQYEVIKPIIVTEASLACHQSVCPELCHETDPNCPPPEFFAAQANYAIRLYSRVWANGLLGASWFQLHFNKYWRYTSLLDEDKNPRPVYTAIQFMSSLLSGATYTGQLSNERVEGYQFQNDESSLTYQIYWTNHLTATESLPLPANTLAVYDKLGQNITPSSSTIMVSFEPILIKIGAPPAECDKRTIHSIHSGSWDNPANWNASRVPNSDDFVWIQEEHTITAPAQVSARGLCNEGVLKSSPHNSLELLVSDFLLNYQAGQIVGQDGSVESDGDCGTSGSTIQIGPPSPSPPELGGIEGGRVAITNRGQIRGGKGGDGIQCAGDGGSVYLLGRNTSNESTARICAGNGGSLLPPLNPPQTWRDSGLRGGGGKGGETSIRGNFGGLGDLTNKGVLCSGNGGHANPNSPAPQQGGDGGKLTLVAHPNVDLQGGTQMAGQGGRGSENGSSGRDGQIWIDPELISLGKARIEGGDIAISGGPGTQLDLRNAPVISATASITLAIGTGGVIDLSGNEEVILWADEKIVIFSDDIRLDEGVTLTDVVSAPTVVTDTAQSLRDFTIVAPQLISARPSIPQPINLTILNNSLYSDTYDLTLTDSAGWTLSELPTAVTVEGLGGSQLALNVTAPDNATHGQKNTITFTVTSQNDPQVNKIAEIEIVVNNPIIYLPLIRK